MGSRAACRARRAVNGPRTDLDCAAAVAAPLISAPPTCRPWPVRLAGLIAGDRVDVAEELVEVLQVLVGEARAVDGGDVLGQVVDGAGAGEHDVATRFVAGEAVGGLRD